MTIDEAIEILSRSADEGRTRFDNEFRLAERLGIEALKRELFRRRPPFIAPFGPLPGETKE